MYFSRHFKHLKEMPVVFGVAQMNAAPPSRAGRTAGRRDAAEVRIRFRRRASSALTAPTVQNPCWGHRWPTCKRRFARRSDVFEL